MTAHFSPMDEGYTDQHARQRIARDTISRLSTSRLLQHEFKLGREALREVLQRGLDDVMGVLSATQTGPTEPLLGLVFSHECLHVSCPPSNKTCKLCKNSPKRRCMTNFTPKYLQNDTLKAGCGAMIRVEVVRLPQAGGGPVDLEEVSNVYLEMVIVDAREYNKLVEMRMEDSDEDVEKIMLTQNNNHKPLLQAGRSATVDENYRVQVPLQRCGSNPAATLPDLMCDGSSEALLSGQKPKFRLLVRAMDKKTKRRVSWIGASVSEEFVVATQRVRGACKAAIPLITYEVKKLNGVGQQTASKMMNISEAAQAAGVSDLGQMPKNEIITVGDFRDMVEWAEQDRHLCEQLKKVLKLTKGWEEAREHARLAVIVDNNLRLWWTDSNYNKGLLFHCHEGTVRLDSAAGYIERIDNSQTGQKEDHLREVAAMGPDEKLVIEQMVKLAHADWMEQNHTRWAMLTCEWEDYLKRPNVVRREHSLPVPADEFPVPPPPVQPAFPFTAGTANLFAFPAPGILNRQNTPANPFPPFVPGALQGGPVIQQRRNPTRIALSSEPIRASYEPPPGAPPILHPPRRPQGNAPHMSAGAPFGGHFDRLEEKHILQGRMGFGAFGAAELQTNAFLARGMDLGTQAQLRQHPPRPPMDDMYMLNQQMNGAVVEPHRGMALRGEPPNAMSQAMFAPQVEQAVVRAIHGSQAPIMSPFAADTQQNAEEEKHADQQKGLIRARENDDEGMEDGHKDKRLMIRMRLSHLLMKDVSDQEMDELTNNFAERPGSMDMIEQHLARLAGGAPLEDLSFGPLTSRALEPFDSMTVHSHTSLPPQGQQPAGAGVMGRGPLDVQRLSVELANMIQQAAMPAELKEKWSTFVTEGLTGLQARASGMDAHQHLLNSGASYGNVLNMGLSVQHNSAGLESLQSMEEALATGTAH